eukprot:8124012-Lingulodinium_polyedra.AAC.1
MSLNTSRTRSTRKHVMRPSSSAPRRGWREPMLVVGCKVQSWFATFVTTTSAKRGIVQCSDEFEGNAP